MNCLHEEVMLALGDKNSLVVHDNTMGISGRAA